jgi:hypothetical protein
MAKKKKKSRKTSWKRKISLGLQTTLAFVPEITALADSIMRDDYSNLHVRVIKNRTGYDIRDGSMDIPRAAVMNGISIAGPILVRQSMKAVR